MKSSASKIKMTSYEELFSGGNAMQPGGNGNVQEIPLSELFPFKNHPYKVLDDETMRDTVESIKVHGVIIPGIVRPRAEGGYELVAGHRRRHASELAGKATMPVIVRELDDDEATLVMVDSNIQRENLLPSEKAWAYKMKLDALKRKAGRPKKEGSVAGENNSGQVGQKLKGKTSVGLIAEESGESYKQVQRYIRLTELLPPLLQMTDDKKLSFNAAVELSYLSKEEQGQTIELMQKESIIPSLEQTRTLKKYSQEGKLDGNVIEVILSEQRQTQGHVTLKENKLKQYFPMDYTREQMEEVIYSLLATWKMRQKE